MSQTPAVINHRPSVLVGRIASVISISDRKSSLTPSSSGMPNNLWSEGSRKIAVDQQGATSGTGEAQGQMAGHGGGTFHRRGARHEDDLPRSRGRIVHQGGPHVVDRFGQLSGSNAAGCHRLTRSDRRQHSQNADAETFVHIGGAVQSTATEFQADQRRSKYHRTQPRHPNRRWRNVRKC